MTRPRRRSPCRSRTIALAAAALGAVTALRSSPAAAQACCAGGAVVTPTRLATQEDYAIGLQMRARSNLGAFAADGGYAASSGADQVLEQDLAGAVRVFRRAQVGLLLPMLQTHRSAPGLDEWGGGIGDLAVTARYDFLLAADAVHWPGIALLAGATLPTGTPPEQATQPLVTDATGAGSYDATLGLGIEEVGDHAYGAFNGWLTHRFARSVSVPGAAPLTESFSLRWTLLAVGGWVFDNEAGVALYARMFDEGDQTIDGVRDPTTRLRLTTVGAAGVLPIRELWRVQGSVFSDVMLPSFGRNQLAGVGLSVSLVRVWL